jgi:hypothetical protein
MLIAAKKSLATQRARVEALLAIEPNGLAIDFERDKVLIKDSTGRTTYYGNFSAKFNASSRFAGSILVTELPFSQSVGTVVMSHIVHKQNVTQTFYDFTKTDNTTDRIAHYSADTIRHGFQITSASTIVVNASSATANPASGTPLKVADRWQLNQATMYTNGALDGTEDVSCGMPTVIEKLYIAVSRTGADPFLGTMKTFVWIPRFMTDAEFARASTP